MSDIIRLIERLVRHRHPAITICKFKRRDAKIEEPNPTESKTLVVAPNTWLELAKLDFVQTVSRFGTFKQRIFSETYANSQSAAWRKQFLINAAQLAVYASLIGLAFSVIQTKIGIKLYLVWLCAIVFVPDPSFVADLVTFYTAVVTILVPVTLSIVSQITDRYGSTYLAKQFIRIPSVSYFPILLLSNVGLAVAIHFCKLDSFELVWRPVAYLLLFFFLTSTGMLFQYISAILKMLDSEKVLQVLKTEIESGATSTSLSGRSKVSLAQSISSYGDVLVYETNKQHIEFVLEWCETLNDVFCDLLTARAKNPEAFESLMASEELLELSKNDPEKAALHVMFFPAKALATFSAFILVFARVHQAAVKIEHERLKVWSAAHFSMLLRTLVCNGGIDVFINQLVSEMSQLLRSAVERKDTTTESSIMHWYRHVVLENDACDSSYVPSLSLRFFGQMQILVNEKRYDTIYDIIQYFTNFHLERDWKLTFDYGDLLLRSNKEQFKELDKNEHLIAVMERLDSHERASLNYSNLREWLKQFEGLTAVIDKNLGEPFKEQAAKLKSDIILAMSRQYKFNWMFETFFLLGAFALYQKENNIIRRMWEANQPADTSTHWMGHDIVPASLTELILVAFTKDSFERAFEIAWDGHHGAEQYFDEYFVLCVARLILGSKRTVNPTSVSLNISGLSSKVLKIFIESADDLLVAINRVKQNHDTIQSLGLADPEHCCLFDYDLPNLITSVKDSCIKAQQSRLFAKPLDRIRVSNFKMSCKREFTEHAVIRGIFKKNKTIVDRTNLKSGDPKLSNANVQRLLCTNLIRKETFLSRREEEASNEGAVAGIEIANAQNEFFVSEFLTRVVASTIAELENKTLNAKEYFAITSTITVDFHTSKSIRELNSVDGIEALEAKPWGHLLCKNGEIPVFVLKNNQLDEKMLIINFRDAGWLIQYGIPPHDEHEKVVGTCFEPEIVNFELNPKLLDETEAAYQNSGNPIDRNFLRQHVLYRGEQLFKYRAGRKSIGFVIDLPFDD